MGVDLSIWVDTVCKHPLKFKYKGLEDAGGRRGHAFFTNVGDAAVSSESFMDDYVYRERSHYTDMLELSLKEKRDVDEMLSRYCEYLADHTSAADWDEALPDIKADTIWYKAPDEVLLKVAEALPDLSDEWADWSVGDINWHWEDIKSDFNIPYLLKEHPPIECLDHASNSGVPVEDVFFLCPSCHQQPTTEEESQHRFYCGLCGAESVIDKDEDMIDFLISLDVTPYPFNEEKRKEWLAKMEQRSDGN